MRSRSPTSARTIATAAVDAVATATGPAVRRRSLAAPDDEQITGVAQRGEEAEDDAEGRIEPYAPADDARDQDDPDEDDRERASDAAARRSPNSGPRDDNPTTRTWRLPRTVARPAPTSSMA